MNIAGSSTITFTGIGGQSIQGTGEVTFTGVMTVPRIITLADHVVQPPGADLMLVGQSGYGDKVYSLRLAGPTQ